MSQWINQVFLERLIRRQKLAKTHHLWINPKPLNSLHTDPRKVQTFRVKFKNEYFEDEPETYWINPVYSRQSH